MVDFTLLSELNIWAIFFSALAAFLVGAFWYSPMMFARPWMKGKGISPSKAMKGNMGFSMVMNFLANLVQAFILAFFLDFWGKVSMLSKSNVWWENLTFVFWIWLAFILVYALNEVLWGGQKPSVFFIQISCNATCLFVMTTILSHWS